MARKSWRVVGLAMLLAVALASVSLATHPLSPVRAADDGHCGTSLRSYNVSTTDGRTGGGIRCVLGLPGGDFAWYGEGGWDGGLYYHIGYAKHVGQNQWIGYAADLENDPTASGNVSNGTLSLSYDPSVRAFHISGDWDEDWTLIDNAFQGLYIPGPPLTACGQTPGVVAYDAHRGSFDGPLQGLRCVYFPGGGIPNVWLGNGSNYTHLGTWDPAAGLGMAVDLCNPGTPDAPGFGSVCGGQTPYNGLSFVTIIVNGKAAFIVGKTWNETWVAR